MSMGNSNSHAEGRCFSFHAPFQLTCDRQPWQGQNVANHNPHSDGAVPRFGWLRLNGHGQSLSAAMSPILSPNVFTVPRKHWVLLGLVFGQVAWRPFC